MNWTKQTYLSASALAEQRQEKITEIIYSFDAQNTKSNRIADFFCGKGEVTAEVEVMGSEAVTVSIFVNDIFAGEFGTQKFALAVILKEGLNSIRFETTGKDKGMVARIKGIKVERIYSPLKVIGSTEFGEGCLMYTYENQEVYQRLFSANGDVTANKVLGYKYFDSKNCYTESGAMDRLVSIGINDQNDLIYFDKSETLNLGKADKAVLVEKTTGGAYIFYTQNKDLYLTVMDDAKNVESLGKIVENVEDIFAATSGSILFYKQKAKWWSIEFVKSGKIVLVGKKKTINLKVSNLNAINQPNADSDNCYYLCRGGNMYKYHNNEKDVIAYCEFFIPFKAGGVMIWSKKLYAYLNGK